MQALEQIKHKIAAYKKKFYLNQLVKGSIIFFAILLVAFLSVALAEYIGKFNSGTRTFLFFSFVLLALYTLVRWIIIPVWALINMNKNMSDEDAAREIGKYFPMVKDKLLNTLQLERNIHQLSNPLIIAGIEQKTSELKDVSFVNAISIKENKSLVYKYLTIPAIVLLLLLFLLPSIFYDSTTRIIHYNKEFIPEAPFQFVIENENLSAFRNEDFIVELRLKGEKIPSELFINSEGLKRKVELQENGLYSFTFRNLSSEKLFTFEASGFQSNQYKISIIDRPVIQNFKTVLNFPAYLNKQNEQLNNTGNLTIPEGTTVSWYIDAEHTNEIEIAFANEKQGLKIIKEKSGFNFQRKLTESTNYNLNLKNDFSTNKNEIKHYIDVIKDQYPKINVNKYEDTVSYKFIMFSGFVQDDYGLSKLQLNYRKVKEDKDNLPYKTKGLDINKKQNQSNLSVYLPLDTFKLKPGERLEYYLEVWDNDGVNGPKSTRTEIMRSEIPSLGELENEIKNASNKTEKSVEKTLQQAQQLTKEMKNVEDKLKGKKNLDWQDKKEIEKMLDSHKKMQNELEKLKEEFDELEEKRDMLNQKENKELEEKVEMLRKLMEELLDEETKKLMEELEKLLNDKAKIEDVNKVLEKIKDKDKNMVNEIDRTLELYKQLKFEQKLNDIQQKLEDLAEKQENLADETDKKNAEENAEKQEELNEEFKELEKELEELEKMNESMENKNEMDDFSGDQEKISKDMEQAKDALQKGQQKKGKESQKDAAKKMQEMAQKMQEMQQSMEMQQAQENLDDLRDILENLVKLSFDQEDLMKEFRKIRQNDPRFVQLGQTQLKLNDNAVVIEDSLLALAKRVFQIQSFVTREVNEMKSYMKEATDEIKERRAYQASGKQQYAMTSMNNLALLLSDIMKQMQEQMAQQMQGDQMCSKPGSKGKPGLGKMQEQLNNMIQQLKSGQKSGRELSEELGKLAAQQEMIRRALKEMEGKGGKTGGNQQELNQKLKELEKLMEETEKDIVNKNITPKTINRQQDILTRLLEAEKAARERDYDEKRESNTAKRIERTTPPALEEYLKKKEQQTELIRTIPPGLNPYYKKEADDYFQKIQNY